MQLLTVERLKPPQSEGQGGDTQDNTVQKTTLVRHCLLYPRSPICRFDRVKAMMVPVGEQ